MNHRNRRKHTSSDSDRTEHRSEAGSTPWASEKPSRQQWARKRKRQIASRPRRFDEEIDDEIDEEDDLEDVQGGRARSLPRYADVSAEGRAAGEEIAARAGREKAWGIASAIDIYECDPRLIRDAEAIRRFVVELCELIDMKRFGDAQVVHFGEEDRVAGFSMVQLIETSLISGHFANLTNAVYLDVFSCKPYNPQVVREFSQRFFRGDRSFLQVAIRR